LAGVTFMGLTAAVPEVSGSLSQAASEKVKPSSKLNTKVFSMK